MGSGLVGKRVNTQLCVPLTSRKHLHYCMSHILIRVRPCDGSAHIEKNSYCLISLLPFLGRSSTEPHRDSVWTSRRTFRSE